MKIRLSFFVAFSLAALSQANALTKQQSMALKYHGMWEWVIQTCPTLHRGYGYWYALTEVGEFRNAKEIISYQSREEYDIGWQTMIRTANSSSVERACELAFSEWPAVFVEYDETQDE